MKEVGASGIVESPVSKIIYYERRLAARSIHAKHRSGSSP
jgi:hypothetical protein